MTQRKKYTPFEKTLLLLPKLSIAECLIIRDALEELTPRHLWYIKHSLKHQRLSSYKRTVNPTAGVKITNTPYDAPMHGRMVDGKWRPISKKEQKKYRKPMTITTSEPE